MFHYLLRSFPEGRPGMSDDSPPVWNLRAVIWFNFAVSSLVLLPSPVTLFNLSFSACWSFTLNFFLKIPQYFSCAACCLMALVFAVMHLYNFFFFLRSCPFLFLNIFLKAGIDESTEWSTIPACPSLMCFFNMGETDGTDSSKILCSMFVYVLFYVYLCTGLILWFLNNLWFDDLCARVNRRQIEHCF